MDSTNPRPADEPDARNSLRHILANEPEPGTPPPIASQERHTTPTRVKTEAAMSSQPALQPRIKEEPTFHPSPHSQQGTSTRPASPIPDSTPQPIASASDKPMYTATTTTTRRNANGSVSSVYSGNKIRHLKKEDGVPLWRKDIQFDFLKYVFEDEKLVFHKVSDGSYGYTFADIYLDAMAKSSKCSKILKEKLLTDRPAALNMAMVCLLVNVGRMNTTLNFFPEMRAQLRTYHSIPSLQAQQDPNAYKQLQDAPRLKSILKGATEDVEQPSSLEDIRDASIPRTNPVNLIFVLAQYAPKISEMHFDVPRDFFDLVMKPGLSSRSRATAFLWLMWWYLESDFTSKDALANPYGPGRRTRDADETVMPIKTPQFEYLTDEQAQDENVDTQEEIEFGELKRQERVAILATDMAPVITGPKRSSKKAYNQGVGVFSMASDNDTASPSREYGSPAPSLGAGSQGHIRLKPASSIRTDDQYDSDRTRSASPTESTMAAIPLPPKPTGGMRINTLLNDDTPTPPAITIVPVAIPPAPIIAPIPIPALAPLTVSAPAPAASAPAKGPGRGNWGHRRKENQAAATAGGSASTGRAIARAQQQVSEEPDQGLLSGSKPHGFYLPLNGTAVEPKRSRPLTSHQQAVERYRKERVDFILDRGIRQSHVEAKRKRVKEGSLIRTWRRCRALPDGWDSEEEMLNESVPVREGVAASALLMMANLRPAHWENNDWGEEASSLTSDMRKVRRRTERWETGEPVVRRKQEVQLDASGLPMLNPIDSTEGMEVDEEDRGHRGSSLPPAMDYEDDMEEADEGRMEEDDDAEDYGQDETMVAA